MPSIMRKAVEEAIDTYSRTNDFIDVDKNGIVIVDDLRKKINEETSLISVIYINNETGAVQPIDKIVEVKTV